LGHDEFFSMQWREPAATACFCCCYMVNQNFGLVGADPGAEQSAPVTETEQAPGKNEPGDAQPSPPAGPPAQIEGFRQARFGMSEEQVS